VRLRIETRHSLQCVMGPTWCDNTPGPLEPLDECITFWHTLQVMRALYGRPSLDPDFAQRHPRVVKKSFGSDRVPRTQRLPQD